jgi:hypothetical protein
VPNESYVVDSFAWFEYFSGSALGARAKPFIESSKGITPTIVVAEPSEKYRREKLPFEHDLDFIIARTRVIPPDTGIAEKAAPLVEELEIARDQQKQNQIIGYLGRAYM